VIPKLGGTHRSGARNTENGGRKNYGNAEKLNYQLMKLSKSTFFTKSIKSSSVSSNNAVQMS
jgi:hypothetical protein